MGHLSAKKSATLVKAYHFRLDADEPRALEQIKYKDVRLQEFAFGPNNDSIFVDVITKFLKKPSKTTRVFHTTHSVVSLWAVKSEQKVVLHLNTQFMKSLCRILPNPTLQIAIQGMVHVPNGDIEKVSEKKSFLLQDALRQGYDIGHGQVSFGELQLRSLNSMLRADLFCDIELGWSEPIVKVASLAPPPSSGDTFMRNLYKSEDSKDLVIVAGNGAEIKCHRLVFEGRSLVLSAMLYPKNGMKESQTGRIELCENSEDGVGHLVKYMYCIDTIPELSCDVAVELSLMAHKYDLSHLENSLKELFLGKEMAWFTPDATLELYFFSRNLRDFGDLRDHALETMTGMNNDELRSCEGFQELNKVESVGLLGKIISLSRESPCRGNNMDFGNNSDVASVRVRTDADMPVNWLYKYASMTMNWVRKCCNWS